MATSVADQTFDAERYWYVVQRRREYHGEQTANLLRLIGIVLFYGVQLINRYGLSLGFLQMPPVESVDETFHQQITALAVVWTVAALAVFLCLQSRVFPEAMKYATTGLDIVLLTAILIVADGPRSPMIVGYFLLVVLAALRLSLPLVRCATAGAAGAWLFLNGYARWFSDRDVHIPRYHQIIVLIALVLVGVTLGQIVRAVRAMIIGNEQPVVGNGDSSS